MEGSASLTLRRQLFFFRPREGVARTAHMELSDHASLKHQSGVYAAMPREFRKLSARDKIRLTVIKFIQRRLA